MKLLNIKGKAMDPQVLTRLNIGIKHCVVGQLACVPHRHQISLLSKCRLVTLFQDFLGVLGGFNNLCE